MYFRWGLAAALCVLAFAVQAKAQRLPPTYITQTHFNKGQNVVPSFDGWTRNPDGSFSMVFGYMNRNYEEEIYIPAGPDNKVEPGPVDQGQPTFFETRRHARLFLVKVPADWPPQKEVVWTINAHGRPEKAYATLQMEYEITAKGMMGRDNITMNATPDLNEPPSITSIAAQPKANVGDPVTLTASVVDDGLPKLRAPRPVAERPAAPATGPGRAQVNSGGFDGGGRGGRGPRGLNVSWFQYGGPAKVVFEPPRPVLVAAGKAAVTVRFSQPGTYVLRATANDTELSTHRDVTITVTGK